MSEAHARLAPSAAVRWVNCPASVKRCEGLPEPEESDDAKLGTSAHLLLEYGLKGSMVIKDQTCLDLGTGVLLNPPDIQAVQSAYEYVTGFGAHYLSESIVNPGSHFGREDCWGTSDIRINDVNNSLVEVADYKHGIGIIVEPEENYQMLLYAIGDYRERVVQQTISDEVFLPDTYRLTIIQPRAPHPKGSIRSWDVSVEELRTKWMPFFSEAMYRTDSPNAPANPSESTCRWCLCKATCPDIAEKAMQAAQAVFEPLAAPYEDSGQQLQMNVARDPSELTDAQITFVLEHEKMIKGWLDSVKAYAENRAINGVAIPRFKIVKGKGSSEWAEPEDVIAKKLRQLAMKDGKRIGKADIFTEKLISPAKARDNLKPLVGDKTWETIDAMISKKQGKPTLVPNSDARIAVATTAENVFGHLVDSSTSDLPDFLL